MSAHARELVAAIGQRLELRHTNHSTFVGHAHFDAVEAVVADLHMRRTSPNRWATSDVGAEIFLRRDRPTNKLYVSYRTTK